MSGGAKVVDLGILPSPAVAFIVQNNNFSCGIVISASHNPPEYNGIKIFKKGGIKIGIEEEEEIEFFIEKGTYSSSIGSQTHSLGAAESYISYLTKGKGRLDGLEVFLDSGHGAALDYAGEAFLRLGAKPKCVCNENKGELINVGCGALHLDNLERIISAANERKNKNAEDFSNEIENRSKITDSFSKEIESQNKSTNYISMEIKRENKIADNIASKPIEQARFPLGFAFDGDADRMGMVLYGKELSGDSVLMSLSRMMPLSQGVVVGTVMSNTALEVGLKSEGKTLLRVDVGDKNIIKAMLENGYNLGGEQSGHYIIYPESVTGDGILSAIYMAMCFREGLIEKLDLVPEKVVSLPAKPEILQNQRMIKMIEQYKQKLLRLVVRMSGTEPKVRIMAESENQHILEEAINDFKQLVTELEENK
jgi:phosphoglucosamine mutase